MNEEAESRDRVDIASSRSRGTTEHVPTLERIDGRVPAAASARGRYVRFFAIVVVLAFAVVVAWGAVMLVSTVHHG